MSIAERPGNSSAGSGNGARNGATVAILDFGTALASRGGGGNLGGAFRGAYRVGNRVRYGTVRACNDCGFACTGRAMRPSTCTRMSAAAAPGLPPHCMAICCRHRIGDGRGDPPCGAARTDRDRGVCNRIEPSVMGVDVVARTTGVVFAGVPVDRKPTAWAP